MEFFHAGGNVDRRRRVVSMIAGNSGDWCTRMATSTAGGTYGPCSQATQATGVRWWQRRPQEARSVQIAGNSGGWCTSTVGGKQSERATKGRASERRKGDL